jgi:hypothetical protein
LFLSPGSAAAPPKLRLLFEACPMAFVVEAAGGASSDADGAQSLLVRPGCGFASIPATQLLMRRCCARRSNA